MFVLIRDCFENLYLSDAVVCILTTNDALKSKMASLSRLRSASSQRCELQASRTKDWRTEFLVCQLFILEVCAWSST